jgi:hypothetical protein
MVVRRVLAWFGQQGVTIRAAFITATLGIIGLFILGIFSLLGPITSEPFQRPVNQSDLELVGASFEESAEATTLDIKVRNTGEEVAYLKEANFNVERTWQLWSTIFPGRVPVSGNYDVTLTPADTPYTRTVELSKRIDPNEVERFTFTLTLNDRARAYSAKTNYVFLTTVDLVYDEDDKVISSEELLFVRELPWQQAESGVKTYFPYGDPGPLVDDQEVSFRKVRAHNEEVVDEIGRIEGIKTQTLEKLIGYISQKT